MDPVSTIVAALVAGAAEAAKPTAVQAVKDAYAGLKALIVRKFSRSSVPLQAVEERPTSEPRQSALKEELADAGADRDAEISSALQNLIATLRQHAPQSVAHISATVSGGVNVQGGTFQGPVNISGGNTIRTGGGAVVQAAVSTGGGAFVGRDQVINNITLHSVDQVVDLAEVLKASMAQLASNPEPDALDAMAVVLDEISKLYQLIDTELTRYLSLSFDEPQQIPRDRAVLVSLDGGQISARAMEARGHCEKISRIYSSRLRPWFQNAGLAPDAINRIEHAFGILAAGDADMSYVIHQLAQWLSQKAAYTLTLVDTGDLTGARRMVKEARLDCQGMRQKLASTISTMRDIQAELLRLVP